MKAKALALIALPVFVYLVALSVRNLSFSTQGELARRWEASMDPDAHRDALANCVTRSSLPTRMHLLDYAQIRGKEAVVALLAENLVKMFEGLPLHPDGLATGAAECASSGELTAVLGARV